MKIAYIVNARIPTEKAHGFQIAKVCEQLASVKVGGVDMSSGDGHPDVTIVIPRRRNHLRKDVFQYYDIKPNFRVEEVGFFDAFAFEWFFGRLTFFVQSAAFFKRLCFYRPSKDTVIISRNTEIVWLFSLRGYQAIYSAHAWPQARRGLFLFFLKRASAVICNSAGTAHEFLKAGFAADRVAVIPNGVDLEPFERVTLSKDLLRAKLGLPKTKIAMYVGHLYGWKGIDDVLDAAQKLLAAQKLQSEQELRFAQKLHAQEDMRAVTFVIVGGTAKDTAEYGKICHERALTNVQLVPHVEKRLVPEYLKTADVLLLPNAPTTEESRRYTSPIKMFEYMASGVPIIASDLPSLHEVLSEKNALFVKAGNGVAIARAVEQVLEGAGNAAALVRAKQALEDVKKYTWKAHAERVVECIGSGLQKV